MKGRAFAGPLLEALREDAAFDYWKNRFAVTSTLDPNDDCGFD